MRMKTSFRPNRPEHFLRRCRIFTCVVAQRNPVLKRSAPRNLRRCVGRLPTTSLRSLRDCDSSFAAVSNHSIHIARKIDLVPTSSLLTIYQPESVGPDPAARIACLHSQSPRITNLEEPVGTNVKPTETCPRASPHRQAS